MHQHHVGMRDQGAIALRSGASEVTDDLQVWASFARYPLSPGFPQRPGDAPDSGRKQRFCRVGPEWVQRGSTPPNDAKRGNVR